MKLPELNKRNWKKVLRELDLSKYPSLPIDILKVRSKILNKQDLTILEDRITLPKLLKFEELSQKEISKSYIKNIDWSKFSHRPPFEFQKEGIIFLLENERCLQCDSQGLGKSIQTIIASQLLPEQWNTLIITTKSLKYNFEAEILHFDNRVSVIEDKWEPNRYTIIHYDQVKKYHKQLIDSKFEIVIIDEVAKIRNHSTQRSVLITQLLTETKQEIQKLWLLSGTLIDHRPYDFYQPLKLCKHPIAKNWMSFVTKYCNAYKDIHDRWDTSGQSNLQELHDKTKSIIIRRLKQDVLEDFPGKTRQSIILSLDNYSKYLKIITDYENTKIKNLKTGGNLKEAKAYKINAMTKLVLWRQYCALEKLKDGSLLDLIETEIEKGNKILVATNFTSVIDYLYEKLGPSLSSILDGRIGDSKERLRIIDDFNMDINKKVLAMNMKVGSVGYNIQSANVVICNDLSWNPSDMEQFEDRAWRIGQKKDVNCYYPIYQNTVEEILYNTIINKSLISSKIIDGHEQSFFKDGKANVNENLLSNLLKQIDSIKV